jgi:hypothetical protein
MLYGMGGGGRRPTQAGAGRRRPVPDVGQSGGGGDRHPTLSRAGGRRWPAPDAGQGGGGGVTPCSAGDERGKGLHTYFF